MGHLQHSADAARLWAPVYLLTHHDDVSAETGTDAGAWLECSNIQQR